MSCPHPAKPIECSQKAESWLPCYPSSWRCSPLRIRHPEPSGSRWATPPSLFQQRSGQSLITGGLWLVAAILILNFWGVSVGGLWALLASIATIIGVGVLATWALISNFTASVFLTLWRPFQLGQTVEILPENLKGRVIERNLMFTALQEDGGSVLQVPNNLFFQKLFRVSGQGEPASS